MKKTYIIVAPKDESFFEVYVEVDDGFCGDFVCQCLTWQYAKKICDALEKPEEETEKKYVLTLGELIDHLKGVEDDPPDSTPAEKDLMKLKVTFNTVDKSDLTLLSCYVCKGEVLIDIGTGEE